LSEESIAIALVNETLNLVSLRFESDELHNHTVSTDSFKIVNHRLEVLLLGDQEQELI